MSPTIYKLSISEPTADLRADLAHALGNEALAAKLLVDREVIIEPHVKIDLSQLSYVFPGVTFKLTYLRVDFTAAGVRTFRTDGTYGSSATQQGRDYILKLAKEEFGAEPGPSAPEVYRTASASPEPQQP